MGDGKPVTSTRSVRLMGILVRPRDPTAHTHRWRLDEPAGPTSLGVCACGIERQFANSEGELSKEQRYGTDRRKRA